MAKGRKGNSVQKTISILAYGDKGTWKSSVGCEALALKRADGKPMRVLVIDSEFGGVDSALDRVVEKYNVDPANAWIVYTESYSEILGLLDKVRNHESFYTYDDEGEETEEVVLDADGNEFHPDFIFFDGTTVVYNASSIAKVKFSEKRAKVKANLAEKTAEETLVAVQGADLEFKDYKKLNTEMSQELILKIISTGVHHYITARETDEKRKEVVVDAVTGKQKTENVPTGNKIPEGFKAMEFNVGTVMRFFVDEFGQVKGQIINKDRNGIYAPNSIIEEPTLLAYQSVIDGNKGKERIIVDPTFKESIDKEYEKELAENNISVEAGSNDLTVEGYYDEIKSLLQKMQPTKKKTLVAELKKSGYTPAYTKLTNIEDLKKYITILKG
ncbi:MAG: hypothetical protein RSC24_06420 [Clostridium sp.]